jgi:hypothetical protein
MGGDMEAYYEDLVRKASEVLKSLEPFIEHGLDYDGITQVGIGSVSVPNKAFRDDQASPIGRWTTDLPQAELATLERLVGGTLQELEYKFSTKGSTSVDLAGMRAAYRLYFESKQYFKTKDARGKMVRYTRSVLGLAPTRSCLPVGNHGLWPSLSPS